MEKTDYGGINLRWAFLLGPVPTARQHDRLAKLRYERREICDELISAAKGDD